jgi:hypothetical protein
MSGGVLVWLPIPGQCSCYLMLPQLEPCHENERGDPRPGGWGTERPKTELLEGRRRRRGGQVSSWQRWPRHSWLSDHPQSTASSCRIRQLQQEAPSPLIRLSDFPALRPLLCRPTGSTALQVLFHQTSQLLITLARRAWGSVSDPLACFVRQCFSAFSTTSLTIQGA